jgi:hypothetical protein
LRPKASALRIHDGCILGRKHGDDNNGDEKGTEEDDGNNDKTAGR